MFNVWSVFRYCRFGLTRDARDVRDEKPILAIGFLKKGITWAPKNNASERATPSALLAEGAHASVEWDCRDAVLAGRQQCFSDNLGGSRHLPRLVHLYCLGLQHRLCPIVCFMARPNDVSLADRRQMATLLPSPTGRSPSTYCAACDYYPAHQRSRAMPLRLPRVNLPPIVSHRQAAHSALCVQPEGAITSRA